MRDLLEELWAAAELLSEEEETGVSPPLVAAPVSRRKRRKKADGEAAAEQAASPATGMGQTLATGRQAEADEAGPLPEEMFLPDEEELWPGFMPGEGGESEELSRRRPAPGGQTEAAVRRAGEKFEGVQGSAAARPAAALVQTGRAGAYLLQEQARQLRAAAELSRALGGRGQGSVTGGESAGGLSDLLLPGSGGPGGTRPVQSAREVDRLFQRDARRYDGAFFLY